MNPNMASNGNADSADENNGFMENGVDYTSSQPENVGNTSIIAMTEEEFQAKIQQEVLKSISSLTSTMAPLLMSLSNAKQSQEFNANPVFPKIDKEDRLTGSKNFIPWRQRLELGLRSNGLSSFINNELGEDHELSKDRRIQLDAQALQYIRSTVSTEIANSLLRFNTAYAAFRHIARTFGNQSLQEKINLELREMRLHFADHYNPVKFVNDFENIIAEHRALGTEFDQEVIVAKFLVRIDDKYKEGHPYSIFYNTVMQCPKETRTIDYVKQRFLDVDNRKCSKSLKTIDINVYDFENEMLELENDLLNLDYEICDDNDFVNFDGFDSNVFINTVITGQKYAEKRLSDSNIDCRIKRPRTDGFKARHDFSASTSKRSGDKRAKTPTELLSMQKVEFTDLYTRDEISKLRNMTKDEKMRQRCGKCGTYFHKSTECKYNSKFCYSCHQFGHIVKDCTSKSKENSRKRLD